MQDSREKEKEKEREKEKEKEKEKKQEIANLEQQIFEITGYINDCQRRINSIGTEATDHISTWRRLLSVGGEKKPTNCVEIMKKLTERDEVEQKKYIEARRTKDLKLVQLRNLVVDVLTMKVEQNPNPTPILNLSALTIRQSSLLSGTTLSLIGDVDCSRLFKNFSFDENETKVKIRSAKTKHNEFDSGAFIAKTYYGKVYRGESMGKEVCVKIYDKDKISRKKIEKLAEHYETMRRIPGHPNLLVPMAASLKEGHEKILVELSQNKQFRSLQDLVLWQPKKVGELIPVKFGFPHKLHISKCIQSALLWLYGNRAKHLRLKPSNILFTADWKVKVADYGLGTPSVPLEKMIETGHAFYYPPEFLEDTKNVDHVDVYSFGLILYTLFQEKIPNSQAKTIEELKKCLKEEHIKAEIEQNWKSIPTLCKLMTDCIQNNPKDRKTMTQLNQIDWNKIYQEALAMGENDAADIWKRAAGPKTPNAKTVPWDSLKEVFFQTVGIPEPKDIQVRCVEEMLYIKDRKVTFENWSRFVRWFSPFQTNPEFVDRVVKLLKAPWFYGRECGRIESESIMSKAKMSYKVKNPFLLRISENKQDQYCLVMLDSDNPQQNTLQNIIILQKDYNKDGIFKYITETYIKPKHLNPTKIERKLDGLFPKNKKEKVEKKGDSRFI